MTDPPLLEVHDLRTEFDTADGVTKAVDGVSFVLEPGQVLALVGESGSGKSVTALSIMGLVAAHGGRIASGDVRLRGVSLVGLPERRYRAVRGKDLAMIFQEPLSSLNPVFTVGNQLIEALRVHRATRRRADARARAIELLTNVGIPDPAARLGDYPHQLSGGMRQRVMIAMAMANDPDVLIADEPTTALDVTVQAQVLEVLQRAREETGAALLLITHDLGLVAGVATRVLVMYGGRVVEEGGRREIFYDPRHPYTDGLLRSVPRSGRRAGRLDPIPGSPPNPTALPSGCVFHPRCPFATERCRDEQPDLRPLAAAGRRVACHYAEELPELITARAERPAAPGLTT